MRRGGGGVRTMWFQLLEYFSRQEITGRGLKSKLKEYMVSEH